MTDEKIKELEKAHKKAHDESRRRFPGAGVGKSEFITDTDVITTVGDKLSVKPRLFDFLHKYGDYSATIVRAVSWDDAYRKVIAFRMTVSDEDEDMKLYDAISRFHQYDELIEIQGETLEDQKPFEGKMPSLDESRKAVG